MNEMISRCGLTEIRLPLKFKNIFPETIVFIIEYVIFILESSLRNDQGKVIFR